MSNSAQVLKDVSKSLKDDYLKLSELLDPAKLSETFPSDLDKVTCGLARSKVKEAIQVIAAVSVKE